MKTLILAAAAAICMTGSTATASESAKHSVTLINAFVVPQGKDAQAIAYWEKAAEFMRKQPGYVSTKLHKSIMPGARFTLINIAKWESADAFRRASSALRQVEGLEPVEGVVPNPALYTVIRSD